MAVLESPPRGLATSQAGAERIAVVIPCCDEEAQVGGVVRAFRAALPGAEIVVVDNASRDATGRIPTPRARRRRSSRPPAPAPTSWWARAFGERRPALFPPAIRSAIGCSSGSCACSSTTCGVLLSSINRRAAELAALISGR